MIHWEIQSEIEWQEKLTHLTEDQQIDVMKTNLQTTGQMTGLSGKLSESYKQNDIRSAQIH